MRKLIIRTKTFEDHKGIPKGGSLPRNSSDNKITKTPVPEPVKSEEAKSSITKHRTEHINNG